MEDRPGAFSQSEPASIPADGAPRTFTVPGRFHPGWSLLGRALRRWTDDRLRAEALHVLMLTGGVLGWLMGVYAAEALSELTTLGPPAIWGGFSGAGLLLIAAGILGVRPPAVVTCGTEAVCIVRGRERLRLPYAALVKTEAVAPRIYHRRYRRYAATHPFLDAPYAPVLLLHMQDGTVAALGLPEEDRAALRRCVEARVEERENGRTGEWRNGSVGGRDRVAEYRS